MKKFFGKKNALIAFAVAAVVFLGGLIAMLASPVFYVGAYKGELNLSEEYKSEVNYAFKAGNKIKAYGSTTIGGEVTEEEAEWWYYRRGDQIVILDSTKEMTEEEFKTQVEQLDKMTDKQIEALAGKISFKELNLGTDEYEFVLENKLAVAFVVIDAVLLALALVGTGLAVYYLKGSKKAKTE